MFLIQSYCLYKNPFLEYGIQTCPPALVTAKALQSAARMQVLLIAEMLL